MLRPSHYDLLLDEYQCENRLHTRLADSLVPTESRCSLKNMMRLLEVSPTVGFKPTTPLSCAGLPMLPVVYHHQSPGQTFTGLW